MEQAVWAAFSLGTFFVAVDKESNSPVGATNSTGSNLNALFYAARRVRRMDAPNSTHYHDISAMMKANKNYGSPDTIIRG